MNAKRIPLTEAEIKSGCDSVKASLEEQARASAVQNGWDTAFEQTGTKDCSEVARKWSLESIDDAIESIALSAGIDQSEINRAEVVKLVRQTF